jgi:hypothetical protein
MKTLHLPFHFHRHEESPLWRRCKDLGQDYRAQSMLTTSILFAMLIILLVIALQAD